MVEWVTIGNAKLALGDCRDILPTLGKVDAVVTDPPYGINAARDRNSEQWGWRDYPENGWDLQRPEPEAFSAILAKAKDAIVWGGNYFIDRLPIVHKGKWLIWDKGQEGFSLADCEMAWCSFEGAIRRINYARGKAMLDGKEHPTQKALQVMKWSIDQLPRTPKTVLDPYLGSGTTGVAAVQSGIPFVGIEASEHYFEIACRRIEDAQRQGNLFSGEAA